MLISLSFALFILATFATMITSHPIELCDELFRFDENSVKCLDTDPQYCTCLKVCEGLSNDCCILFRNECEFNDFASTISKEVEQYDVSHCSGLKILNFDVGGV